MSGDPTTAIAWKLRSREFGQLLTLKQNSSVLVAMEFFPPWHRDQWPRLCEAWRALPPHSNVIQALTATAAGVLLRYAPLAWLGQPTYGENIARLEARQIIQLACVYRMLLDEVPEKIDLFLNPVVKFDLGAFLRVAFLPAPLAPNERPPEWKTKRILDQRALVYIVGRHALRRIGAGDPQLRWDVLERCVARNPADRFRSLDELVEACRRVGTELPIERAGTLATAWTELEQGLGWFQLTNDPDHLQRATEHFATALEISTHDNASAQHRLIWSLAGWGREACNLRRGIPGSAAAWLEDNAKAEDTERRADEAVSEPADVDLRNWASAAAWSKRDFAFGDLRKFDDGRPVIAMEFSDGDAADGEQLREAWLALERPCAILDALGSERNELLLRYAALNWKLPPLFIDTAERVRMACAWLIDIADAYQILAEEQPEAIPWFLNPVVKIDLNLRPRMAFLSKPPDRSELPPEVLGKLVTWDQRSLVFQIGTVMKRLVRFTADKTTPFQQIIDACCQDRPWKRWKNLDALFEAVGLLGFSVSELRAERTSAGWESVEEGFGWLELGENELALAAFGEATTGEYARIARSGAAYARERIAIANDSADPAMTGIVSGAFIATSVDEREPVVRPRKVEVPSVSILVEGPGETLERARRALHVGDLGHAAALAHQARRHSDFARPATLLLAEVHVRRREYAEALRWLQPLLESGVDARAEYVRAKAMFASRRLHEAREGFERALALAPSMIEAMLLRREVDRALAKVRAKVGEGERPVIEIPASLEKLRDVLLSGDTRRVIAALDDADLHQDAEAQLVLARFLAADAQYERALEVYERVRTDAYRFSALLGTARTLLELERDESALALFDQLVAEKPADAEASEGRARALEKLGRVGEAAAEYRRFISLATVGSDLRVRAAQAWLDAHPL